MIGSARSVLMYSPVDSGVVIPVPLAAYSFSEGAGLTSADVSGNGHTLTLNSSSWTTGHTGTGITNTTTGLGAGANLVAPGAAITMMAWIQPLELTPGGSRIALGTFQTGGNTAVAIFTQRGDFGSPNVLQCDIRITSLQAFHGPALTVGVWTHVALTYDGAQVCLYVNGSLYTSGAATGAVSTGDVLTVAGNDPGNSYDSDVTVDDVRIFDVALTAEQVSLAMSTPVA